MKILHLGKYFPPDIGGVERFTYVVAKEIVKLKNEVIVVVFNNSNKFKRERIDNIDVIRLPRIYNIFRTPLTLPIIKLIEDANPDLIHLHIPNPWFELNLLFYFLKYPNSKIVVTYHSDVVNYTIVHFVGNIIRYMYLLPLLFFSKKIMATSENYIHGSFALYLFRNKTSVVPLSIDYTKFKTNDKIKTDKHVLLYVGRLFRYKGLYYLINAIKMLSVKRKDFILYIVGDGELKNNLIDLTRKLKLNKYIKFLGKIPDKDILKYYNSCEIFILPSVFKSEAFGIVQLEAMCFKKPVISTNIKGSGITYVNINNTTGIVVKPKDIESLSDAIGKLLNDKGLRLKMGYNAYKRVKMYFTKEKMIKNILNVYKNVVKGI
ncbi:MAG: glycosyltransferase [Candidatus Aenigmarchaeota archaeon]|nr:glycosyltransferase [Candidatus Aenigmarchaeota archaeon]